MRSKRGTRRLDGSAALKDLEFFRDGRPTTIGYKVRLPPPNVSQCGGDGLTPL
mgnify:CR=1 FL=1